MCSEIRRPTGSACVFNSLSALQTAPFALHLQFSRLWMLQLFLQSVSLGDELHFRESSDNELSANQPRHTEKTITRHHYCSRGAGQRFFDFISSSLKAEKQFYIHSVNAGQSSNEALFCSMERERERKTTTSLVKTKSSMLYLWRIIALRIVQKKGNLDCLILSRDGTFCTGDIRVRNVNANVNAHLIVSENNNTGNQDLVSEVVATHKKKLKKNIWKWNWLSGFPAE